MNKAIVVIGGGAGGMMAAICAARKGAHVTLLDPNERLGKKVNITGKGRCNVTNDSTCEELLAHVPQNPRFLYSAFSRFDGHDAIDFFEGLGVPLKVERGKRVFPVSDRSFDITAALERELRRNLMSMTDEQHETFMEALARRNHCNSVDEMYAAIGYGGLQISRMLPKLKEEYTKLKATEVKPVTVDIKRMHSTDGVVVEGIDNCPIKFAKCCSPLPGDEIIGFVTRGFGVSIHKKDCANVRESMRQGENADRWVNAYWADDAKENYKATLDLLCMDRANLLSDVALALGDMRVPIYSLTARSAEQGRARMSVTVGITNTEHLNSVVARLKKVKDVVSVNRN